MRVFKAREICGGAARQAGIDAFRQSAFVVASLFGSFVHAPATALAGPEALANTKETNSDFVLLLKNWQNCFTRQVTVENAGTVVSACDRAAAFPDLASKERQRLALRRAKLIEFIGQGRELNSTGAGQGSEGKK